MAGIPANAYDWTLRRTADEDKSPGRPIPVRRSKIQAVAFWLSSAQGRISSNHLLQAKGRRVEGAGASVHFKITGSKEPDAVGACMRVLEFNFNVEVRVSSGSLHRKFACGLRWPQQSMLC